MVAKKYEGVRQRGKTSFEINYRDLDGRRHFETIEAESIDEAANVRKTRIGDIAHGKPVTSKPNTVLFEEIAADLYNEYLLNGYSTASDLETRLRLHVLPYFGRRKVAQISTANFKAYRLARKDEGASVATINRELEAMRAAYYLAKECTPPKVLWIPTFPIIKENNVRQGFFEQDALDAICRHLPKHLVPIARFGYITGWRHQEVMTRQWRHVTFAGVSLDPGETKNGQGRTFPMVEPLKTLLDSIRPKRFFPNDLIFTNGGKPIVRFDKAWASACKAAGLPVKYVQLHVRVSTNKLEPIIDPETKKRFYGNQFTAGATVPAVYKRGAKKGQPIMVLRAAVYFHDFRRTAYRNLVWAGIPEKQARLAVGWLDVKTADRYNVPSKSDMDVIRERFDAAYGGKPKNSAAGGTGGGNGPISGGS